MRICLYMDQSRIFRWHGWLAKALSAIPGCQVGVRFASRRHPLPHACTLLFELERLIYGIRDNALDRIGNSFDVAAGDDGTFDVVIDLAGFAESRPSAPRLLTLSFNGIPGEFGAVAAVVNKEAPLVAVHDSARAYPCRTARPAFTDAKILLRGLDEILSCAAHLMTSTLRDKREATEAPLRSPAAGQKSAAPIGAEPPFIGGAALLHVSLAVARKSVRLAELLATGGKAWAVAWRRAPAYALLDARQAQFSVLPEDGRRYYADPFPFCWRGRTFLFVEEFSYAVNRGCISVVEIDETGFIGTPRPVLEEPHHLSYPFIFEQDDEIWMIPESGEAKGIYLYRAENFPFKWRREACLIDGLAAYDSTLLRHAGRLWLFVCERVWNSSSWDTLNLFYAETLTGTWLPHRSNPVLFDGALSRPGGAMFSCRGHDLRPVQDCSKQYGGALSLCRIETLTEDEFSQVPVGRIHCGPYGCHTYNHAGIEVIDVFAKRGLGTVTAFFSPGTAQPELASVTEAAGFAPPLGAPARDVVAISNNTELINYVETAHARHSNLES